MYCATISFRAIL